MSRHTKVHIKTMSIDKLKNRVAFVTGANSGVGLELTKRLLSESCEVIALIRSDFSSGDVVIDDAIASNKLRKYRCDLANFKDLKGVIQEIKNKETKIDVVFNNAGVSLSNYRYSIQEREIHYEVNAVVPYIITHELIELLLKGDLKTVINVSSNSLLMISTFDHSKLSHPNGSFAKLFGPYAASKMALSLWTVADSKGLQDQGISIRSVCPGPNATPMSLGEGMPWWLGWAAPLFFPHPRVGGGRIYDAAFEPKLVNLVGVFINSGKATSFKFGDQKEDVLAEVKRIYEEEYVQL